MQLLLNVLVTNGEWQTTLVFHGVNHWIDEQVKLVANNQLATLLYIKNVSCCHVVIPANKWFYCILFFTTTSNKLILYIGM